jgi:hypothetical protein
MPTALDREFRKLERIVGKYCREGKEENVVECVEWARNYAEDFPQQADIEEAISHSIGFRAYPKSDEASILGPSVH